MKILIYGLNFSPELTGIGKYTGEMADWLGKQGYDVKIITAPPYYPSWKISDKYSPCTFTKEKNDKATVYRCPLWVPSKPKTLTRIVHLLSFTLSSFPLLCKQMVFWHPDAVICLAPPFFCALQTVILSKLMGIKSWLHFQDFEICAMFGTGLVSGGNKRSKIAHLIQAFITRRFDRVSTISQAMCKSAESHRVSRNRVILFPNWVDTDFLTTESDKTYFRNKWNIAPTTKVVLYSGNLGKKQGLEIMLDSAQALKNRQDILFIIVGDGAHKARLMELSKQKQLENIQFHLLQPYNLLPSLLHMADIHLIIQKRGAAVAVLPSKLTSILSIGGHSLITADLNTELGHLVINNPGIATLVTPEDPDALTKAIIKACDDPHIGSNKINLKARQYAEKQLDIENILRQFEVDLQEMLSR